MRKLTSIMISAALIAGCATTPKPAKRTTREETQVFLEHCPFSHDKEAFQIIPLLILNAPSIIKGVVSLAAAAANKYVGGGDAKYSARTDGAFADTGSDGTPIARNHCVTIVRGEFGPEENASPAEDWTRTKLIEMGLVRQPDFYLESRIDYSPNHAAFRLIPSYLEYRAAAAKRGHKSKDLLISYSFERSGVVTSGDNREIGVAVVSLPETQIGSRFNFHAENKNSGSQWVAIPKDIGAQPKNQFPFTLDVTVSEHSPGGEAMKLLAKVLNDNDPALAYQILKQLNLSSK